MSVKRTGRCREGSLLLGQLHHIEGEFHRAAARLSRCDPTRPAALARAKTAMNDARGSVEERRAKLAHHDAECGTCSGARLTEVRK